MKNRRKYVMGALLFATVFVTAALTPVGPALHAQVNFEYNGNWQEGRRQPNWDERHRYRRYYREPDIYYSAPPVYYPPPTYYAPSGPSLNLTFPLFR